MIDEPKANCSPQQPKTSPQVKADQFIRENPDFVNHSVKVALAREMFSHPDLRALQNQNDNLVRRNLAAQTQIRKLELQLARHAFDRAGCEEHEYKLAVADRKRRTNELAAERLPWESPDTTTRGENASRQ